MFALCSVSRRSGYLYHRGMRSVGRYWHRVDKAEPPLRTWRDDNSLYFTGEAISGPVPPAAHHVRAGDAVPGSHPGRITIFVELACTSEPQLRCV